MAFERTIQRVQSELIETFDRLDAFFDLPDELRQFQPAEGEWSIDEILEHITLTSRFLMITLEQSLAKVLKRAQQQPIPDAFGWIRPEHMEPTRTISSADVRHRMKTQRDICLNILHQIAKGEGALHRVRMSVQDLGKLDMYEWLYFLIQHAQRHVVEMDRICTTYHQSEKNAR